MGEETTFMGTKDAAEYLKMPLGTLKWHMVKKHILPQKIAGARIFTIEQLEAFKLHPAYRARPRKPRDVLTEQ